MQRFFIFFGFRTDHTRPEPVLDYLSKIRFYPADYPPDGNKTSLSLAISRIFTEVTPHPGFVFTGKGEKGKLYYESGYPASPLLPGTLLIQYFHFQTYIISQPRKGRYAAYCSQRLQ